MESFNPEEWVDDVEVVVKDLQPYDKFRYNGVICSIKAGWVGKTPDRTYFQHRGNEEEEISITSGANVMRLKKKVDQVAKKGRGGFRRFLPI